MPNNEQQGTTYPVYNQYVYKNGIGWVMVGAAGGARIQINDGTTRNLDTLVINKLTKAEFDAITTPDPDQLYIITDEDTYATVNDLPQPANTNPLKDGISSAGIAVTYSRSDHVHPAELPAQSGNNGKYLTTDGTNVTWATITTPPTITIVDWTTN